MGNRCEAQRQQNEAPQPSEKTLSLSPTEILGAVERQPHVSHPPSCSIHSHSSADLDEDNPFTQAIDDSPLPFDRRDMILLGMGGFGKVFLVKNIATGQQMVAKVVRRSLGGSDDDEEAWVRDYFTTCISSIV